MANGEGRNWIRVSVALDGFYAKYGRWPTRVRLDRGMLDDLRDRLFSPKRWARVVSKLRFDVQKDVGVIAEDDHGAFDYATPHTADFARVAARFGEPDMPIHGPCFVEKAAFTIDGTPFDFEGGPEKWREHCKNVAEKHFEDIGLRHLECDVKLTARFFVGRSSRPRDLDNMLKTLIDGLGGAGLFKPSSGGGKKTVWNTDDHWLCGIDAERYLVDADQPRVELELWVVSEPDTTEGTAQ